MNRRVRVLMLLTGVFSTGGIQRFNRSAILLQAPELDPNRLEVFPNALGAEWANRMQGITSERTATCTCGGGNRFILSVARLDSRERAKGIDTTIEALAQAGCDSLHYVIAGEGDDLEFLQAYAQRLGVGDRVHLV